MKLLETVVAVAVAAMLVLAVAALALGRKPYALRSAVASLVADARSVARTSGSGATIVIVPRDGGFAAALYPYRPLAGADLSLPAVRTLTGSAAITATAIFISSSGTTSSSTTWLPASGTLSTEPGCTSGTQLTFSDGFATETHWIPCASAELQ